MEIRSRDPGHAHLGVVLYLLRREAPSSMSIPNLKRVALLVQKLLGGRRISKLGLVAHHLWVVLHSLRRNGPSYISIPNFKRIAQFVQKLLEGPKI